MKSHLNLAVNALGGMNSLKRSYKTLPPKSIERMLRNLESNMTGRINNNIGLIINTLGGERNRRSRNVNSLLAGLTISKKKPTAYKRPTARPKPKKNTMNMSSLLKALGPKKKTTFKK